MIFDERSRSLFCAWSILSNSRHDARHALPVRTKCIPESRFPFAVFHANHYRSGDHGEGCQRVERDQSCSDAPGGDLAEMTQINGMAHARANASGDQLLAMAGRLKFGQAGNLRTVESLER